MNCLKVTPFVPRPTKLRSGNKLISKEGSFRIATIGRVVIIVILVVIVFIFLFFLFLGWLLPTGETGRQPTKWGGVRAFWIYCIHGRMVRRSMARSEPSAPSAPTQQQAEPDTRKNCSG